MRILTNKMYYLPKRTYLSVSRSKFSYLSVSRYMIFYLSKDTLFPPWSSSLSSSGKSGGAGSTLHDSTSARPSHKVSGLGLGFRGRCRNYVAGSIVGGSQFTEMHFNSVQIQRLKSGINKSDSTRCQIVSYMAVSSHEGTPV